VVASRLRLNPEQLSFLTSRKPNFWTPSDSLDYPRLLLEFQSTPVLYYRGEVEPQENQGILPRIVGTRNASEYMASDGLAK